MEFRNRVQTIRKAVVNMKKMQSYHILFYTLEHCYWICREEDLVIIIGSMDPEMMADGYPIDPAPLSTWWDDIVAGADVGIENYSEYIYRFLEYYEDRFGFQVPEAKKLVKNETNARLYREALEYSERLYAKYGYKD